MSATAVFLDRDGVLNEAFVRDGRPYPPATVDDLRILPGVADALDRLRSNGHRLIVVTNQPDVARGTLSAAALDAIHARLHEALPQLDAIYVCPHDSGDGCDCRKPRPGMLMRGAAEFGLDLAHSYMVGDRWRDIEAGENAGCRTVFVDYGYAEQRPAHPHHTVASLADAARIIVSLPS